MGNRSIVRDETWKACLKDAYTSFIHDDMPVDAKKTKMIRYANAVWCMKASYADFAVKKDSRRMETL